MSKKDLPIPQSRNEEYLNAIATGDLNNLPDEPASRVEKYLAYIAENTSFGENLEKAEILNINLNEKIPEATEKIETLTNLNTEAIELADVLSNGLSLNSELVRNVEEAKVANNNLEASNQEAVSKNTELQASLKKTKEFIEGLDGSQNIPQIRLDVTELQNGLKSNQSLSYEGSSISANDTLEGRTEGMRIKGRTIYKKSDGAYTDTLEEGCIL
ncbi:MAG: hypothetical protein E6343_07675, partial [Clostridium perfringens]|nr:hypothetical protein [Clostridium perfringens]